MNNVIFFYKATVGCQLHIRFCQADQIVFGVKSPHRSGEARPSILSEFIREIAGKSHEPELAFQEHRAVITLHRDCSGTPLIVFDVHVRIDCSLTAGSRVPLGKHEMHKTYFDCWDFPFCSSFLLESQTLLFGQNS